MKRIYILIVSLLSLIYSNSFSIKDKTENYSIYQFNIGSIAIENKSEFDYIQAETSGRTQQIGAPDLPTYSFNYSIDRNKNYDIQYIINEFEIYENVGNFSKGRRKKFRNHKNCCYPPHFRSLPTFRFTHFTPEIFPPTVFAKFPTFSEIPNVFRNSQRFQKLPTKMRN